MTQRDLLLSAMADGRLIRPRDLQVMGDGGKSIHRHVLHRLLREGTIVREPEGFRLAGAAANLADVKWQEIALRHPGGIICLEAAQLIHGLTDDFPGEYKIAIRRNGNRRSPIHDVKLVSFLNEAMYEVGVVEQLISGNRMVITDRHRTVADMFRPQNFQPADKADAAFRQVALEDGETGIAQVSRYAHALGWGDNVTLAVRTAKEIVRCVTRKP